MREILLKSKYWDNFNLDLYIKYLEARAIIDENNNLNISNHETIN